MENLLVDAFVEVVCHGSDEHALRERRDFRLWYEAVHLRRYGGGGVVAVDGHRLPLLQDLSEAFGERLGRFPHHLPGEYVTHGVHHHGSLLVAVVALELGEVLKSEQRGDLVRACRGNEVVQPLEIDRRQLVDDDGRFELSFLVDEFHDAAIVEAECRPVDVLAVGIVAHDQYFRIVGIVYVEGELVARHDPIKLRRNHARKRNLGRGDLSLQLVLCSAEPCVHKWREVVFEFGV